jgi:hypothetical protein
MIPAPMKTHCVFAKHFRLKRACKCALNENENVFVFVYFGSV